MKGLPSLMVSCFPPAEGPNVSGVYVAVNTRSYLLYPYHRLFFSQGPAQWSICRCGSTSFWTTFSTLAIALSIAVFSCAWSSARSFVPAPRNFLIASAQSTSNCFLFLNAFTMCPDSLGVQWAVLLHGS